eukprot:scaffold1794_cov107-Cylindrotheca_fusiformis.AAC.1
MSYIGSTKFRAASAGGCYKNGKPICVEEPKDDDDDICDEGTFQSAHYLRNQPVQDKLRMCSYSVKDVVIGRCGSDGSDAAAAGGMCSNLASRCDDPSTFIPHDGSCTTIRDKKNGHLTTYGKCNERCSWSEKDCADDEVWTKNDVNCTADKVEVGACFSGYAFCTVSSANCINPNITYLDYKEVQDTRGLTCFLSDPIETDSPTISPGPTTLQPAVLSPTPLSQQPPDIQQEPTVVVKADDIMSTGTIVAITIGAVVFGLLISVGSFYAGRGSRYRNDDDDNDSSEKKKAAAAPVTTINSGTCEVDVPEDLSIESGNSKQQSGVSEDLSIERDGKQSQEE